MKAKRYILRVCNGFMDYVHGGGYYVEEICIPELNLFINEQMAFVSKDCMKTRLKDAKSIKNIKLNCEDYLVHLAKVLVDKDETEKAVIKMLFGKGEVNG